jgi:hypothetical protein
MIDTTRLSHWSLARAALALVFGMTPLSSSAQISADRPSFGDGTATVRPGTFQAGLGYAFNGNGLNSHDLGQLLLRYGVTDALEVRGGVNSYVVNESPVGNGYVGSGIGAKLNLLETETSALSGVATVSLPTGTGVYDTIDDRARQEVKLAFDGALGEGLTLSMNGGASFYYSAGVQDDRAVQWLFIPTLSVDVTDTVGAYVGYAGFYDEGSNENWVEGGLTFLSSLDTQFDVNTGLRVDENANDFFVGLGVAHRF